MKVPLLYTSLLLLAGSSFAAEKAWLIDSQDQWQQASEAKSHLDFVDGFATPKAKTSSFTSQIKSFETKRSAKSITFDQSQLWQNWNPKPNIGPSNQQDAPVALSLGPNNYWVFGRYGSGLPKVKKAKKAKKGKAKVNVKAKQLAPKQDAFQAEDATLEGFDIALKTTRFPNQFDAP